MDSIRRMLATIQQHLGAMNPLSKLLIGAVVVILLLVLFVVGQFSSKQQLVELLPGATADDAARVVAYLDQQGIEYTAESGKVMVASDRKYSILGRLTRANQLPSDSTVLFANLADKQNWMMPKSQQDQLFNLAKMNELARIIEEWPGIERAEVFVDNPEPRGFGSTFRKPTGQVTVFTEPSYSLDASTVDALAATVASAVAGLDAANVPVIDGAKRRRFKARQADDLGASDYMEHVIRIEQRIQDKVVEHLGYIENLQVSVNAMVDADRATTETHKVLPKGSGSEQLLSSEKSTTSASTESSSAAEAGLGSNVAMDINTGGGDQGSKTSDETADTEFTNEFGHETRHLISSPGKPRKINVTLSVPRDYIEAIARQGKPAPTDAAAPEAAITPAEIDEAFKKEETRLSSLMLPLVETEATQGGQQAGSVVVSMIPVPRAAWPAGMGGGGAEGAAASLGGGVFSQILGSELLKTGLLGLVAVVALGLMFNAARKAGQAPVLPDAQELAGIPPALDRDSDLVGEADESDNAMLGIEIDDETLKSKRMLEEVAALVKENPGTASNVLKQWVSGDD